MAGQIVRRGPNAWLVRIPQGRDANGTRKYHNRTVRGTRKDAERYRTRILREMDVGTFVQASPVTLAEYLAEWLTSTAAQRVSQRTFVDYSSHVTRHLLPLLGHHQLGNLTTRHIQSGYSELTNSGLSSRTVRYVHSVLHNALEHAVRWQMLARNPAKGVSLPRVVRREMTALSVDEAQRFLVAARGDRFETLWLLLLTTGLRPGEALGLRWRDIREERVHVQRSLVWLRGHDWELKEPKTARARRVVTLPTSTVEALRSHRTAQNTLRLRAGAKWIDNELVFTNNVGRPLEWRVLTSRYFRKLKAKAGLPRLRPYDLRHSCATLLLAAGENIKVVSERLGHVSAALTLDVYSHVLPDMQQGAADRMEALISGAVDASGRQSA